MAELLLYHTEGCHLCEQAEAMLQQLGLQHRCVDIADDDALAAIFGIRIPVLEQQGQTLDWPFTPESIVRFIDTKLC